MWTHILEISPYFIFWWQNDGNSDESRKLSVNTMTLLLTICEKWNYLREWFFCMNNSSCGNNFSLQSKQMFYLIRWMLQCQILCLIFFSVYLFKMIFEKGIDTCFCSCLYEGANRFDAVKTLMIYIYA